MLIFFLEYLLLQLLRNTSVLAGELAEIVVNAMLFLSAEQNALRVFGVLNKLHKDSFLNNIRFRNLF